MAGALLGLLGGGVLGYAGQQHRQTVEAEHEAKLFAQQMFLQGLQQNPGAIDNPEIQKQGKKHFGKQWELMSPVFQAAAATQKRNQAQFAQLFGGGAPTPAAGGASGGPQAAPTPTMTKPPATLPAAQITGPQGAPTAPQAAQADPQAGPTPEQQLPALTAALGSGTWTPEQRSAISTQITNLRDQIKERGTMADRAESRAERMQIHQDSVRLQEMSLQMTNSIREASLQETKLQHEFLDQATAERTDQGRLTAYNNLVGSLTKQAQHIEDMVRSATPPDPQTLDSAINDYNRNLRRAKQLGISNKYDTTALPDPKKRGARPTKLFGLKGGEPTVESDTSGAAADVASDLPAPPPGFKVAN